MTALLLAAVLAVNPYGFNHHLYAYTNGEYTGYRVSIQVRPGSQVPIFAWAGGHLTDGTFIQSGIFGAIPGAYDTPYAFFWSLKPPIIRQYDDPAPVWDALPMAVGDWYTFEGTTNGRFWSFHYTGPDGVRVLQGYAPTGAPLRFVQFEAEPLFEEWGWFPTQAMRALRVRVGNTWTRPGLYVSPIVTPDGTASMKQTPGPNLVFRWTLR